MAIRFTNASGGARSSSRRRRRQRARMGSGLAARSRGVESPEPCLFPHKKRDVFADATVRTAHVVPVALTLPERAFYDAVTGIRPRQRSRRQRGDKILRNNGSTKAGCVQHAAARDRFLGRAKWRLDKELDAEVHDLEEVPHSLSVDITQKVLDAARSLGDIDTKYEELLRLLRRVDEEETGRKIILFAYYKGTLEYSEGSSLTATESRAS